MDTLGVWQERIDLILVNIRMRIWIRGLFNFLSDSSPLRDRAKNDIVLYGMIFQKCIGPDMFSWIRHYMAEVCSLHSALLINLRHRRWTEVTVFTPFCLFVCEQYYGKTPRRISTKLGGQVGCVTTTNCFDFGVDPNPDLDKRII